MPFTRLFKAEAIDLDDVWHTEVSRNSPSINVRNGSDEFSVEVFAPDLKINIAVDEYQLVISFGPETPVPVSVSRFRRKQTTGFSRTFNLPENVDRANITARYVDGVLLLSIPKITEQKQIA